MRPEKGKVHKRACLRAVFQRLSRAPDSRDSGVREEMIFAFHHAAPLPATSPLPAENSRCAETPKLATSAAAPSLAIREAGYENSFHLPLSSLPTRNPFKTRITRSGSRGTIRKYCFIRFIAVRLSVRFRAECPFALLPQRRRGDASRRRDSSRNASPAAPERKGHGAPRRSTSCLHSRSSLCGPATRPPLPTASAGRHRAASRRVPS